MFASDFGYGKGEVEPTRVCYSLIFRHRLLPILLSHWDSDHYRIAISPTARDYVDTVLDCRNRIWIAPNNITGTVAPSLAKTIGTKWLKWPWNTDSVQVGNIHVVQCHGKSGAGKPDKNNNSALALVLGSGDYRTLYPGDANFECIPGIDELSGKVSHVIATHHGSERSLELVSRETGSSIPEASLDGNHYVVYSYRAYNHFHHDVKNVGKYYEGKGYINNAVTAKLDGSLQDTLEIPITPWPASIQSEPVIRSIQGLKLLPEQATNSEILADDYDSDQPWFEKVVDLQGSDQKDDDSRDDLASYAIRDKHSDIVSYNIIVQKLILRNPPLCVPCSTDFPIEVRIQCQDIEIYSSITPVPLVRFNVADGESWLATANTNEPGRAGEPGYAGGYLNLSVAERWIVKTPNEQEIFESAQLATNKEQKLQLSLQYRGGRPSNGQKGGRGSAESAGQNGTDDKIEHFSSPIPQLQKSLRDGARATAGGDGGQGAKGGKFSAAGAIGKSILRARTDKVPSGDKLTFSLDLGDEKTAFGVSTPGSGKSLHLSLTRLMNYMLIASRRRRGMRWAGWNRGGAVSLGQCISLHGHNIWD